MSGYLTVVALALLPAAGNFLGGLVSEFMTVSRRTLSLALHLAAGIVLAVVGIELMPEALEVDRPWLVLVAFVLGGFGFVMLERGIGWVRGRFAGVKAGESGTPAEQEETEPNAGPWAIYFGFPSISSATAS